MKSQLTSGHDQNHVGNGLFLGEDPRDRELWRILTIGDARLAGALTASLPPPKCSSEMIVPAVVERLSSWTCNREQICRIISLSALSKELLDACNWEEESETIIDSALTQVAIQKTELGLALHFARQHFSKLRYCEQQNKWYAYESGRWRATRTGQIEFAKSTVLSLHISACKCTDDKKSEALSKFARSSETARTIRAISELAKSDPVLAIRYEEFDKPDRTKSVLNVPNGAVDLRSGELLPHDSLHYLTSMCPTPFDGQAQCPEWRKFLRRIFDNDEPTLAFVQRLVGYWITGETSQRVFTICHGSGDNGKSTFFQAIMSVLGSDYTQKIPTSTLTSKKYSAIPNDIARMKSARLAIASESQEGDTLDEALVKLMTGNESIAARFLREEFFEFFPQFKVSLSTNHKPELSGDKAIWNRVIMIPFNVTIPKAEQDPNLLDKFKAEAEGILAYAVEGAKQYYSSGLNPPVAVLNATDEYRRELDSVRGFIGQCLVLTDNFTQILTESPTESEELPVGAEDLYIAYTAWCESDSKKPLDKKKFRAEMIAAGFEQKRTNRGSVWPKVRLAKYWKLRVVAKRTKFIPMLGSAGSVV